MNERPVASGNPVYKIIRNKYKYLESSEKITHGCNVLKCRECTFQTLEKWSM